ncbi:MAG: hypothetical protein M3P44_14855 [Actinomycetota bacterium]|nr:hypothetical protein [Actinomycetota bacterium]
MRREEFEHVIAAAANVIGQDEFVVIGSQAILGTHPVPPAPMLTSMEADIYPLHDPAKAADIDGALGDGSQFQRTFGYYAHGVGPETVKAPEGWRDRLVAVAVPARVGSGRAPVAWCLEVHDLVLSKCAAGRDRDWAYAREALRASIVRGDVLLERVALLPVVDEVRDHVEGMLRAIIAGS